MIYSPLRYPGGKNQVSKFVQKVIETNNLEGGLYVEPYAGGASVALSLLLEKKVSKIVINDYDRSIFAFWYCILNDSERFCNEIRKTKVNVKTWRKQKEIQRNKKTTDLFSLGFSTFFLNRTNRSGVLNAGPIGGLRQEGEWKINARFNKKELIRRIVNIAKFKKSIKLYNLDAVKLIERLSKKMPKQTLIYFDPPYYVKGKNLYVNYYTHEDHVVVAKVIKKLTVPRWIVSYDNVKQIKRLYKGQNKLEYVLKYSAVNGTQGREIMFYSKNLNIKRGS